MTKFTNKILFVGYGAVAECTLPILFKYLDVAPGNITVMDFEDRTKKLEQWTAKGVHFVRDRVTKKNMGALLGKFVGAGDVIIDLAWNIDACEILDWCHKKGVLYVNTSTELWDPYAAGPKQHPTEKTLYWRHMNVRRMMAKWKTKGPTAVLEHGANPGLISHFTKQGLLDIAAASLADKKFKAKPAEKIAELMASQQWNHLAHKLGVKVIHCSERDTQISNKPKRVDEFVNTWSIEGFREEGQTTAELGWGTHEKTLPRMPPSSIRKGRRIKSVSQEWAWTCGFVTWVPNYTERGMVVRHGEAFTISDKLTVWEGREAGLPPNRCTTRIARATPPSPRSTRCEATTTMLERQSAHHERRDQQRLRHPRRADHGPRV